MECIEGIEGVREHCCTHELPFGHKHFPGFVCCWCGDIYAIWDFDHKDHGENRPDFFKKPKSKKTKRSKVTKL
jgi:hypothetical protein